MIRKEAFKIFVYMLDRRSDSPLVFSLAIERLGWFC